MGKIINLLVALGTGAVIGLYSGYKLTRPNSIYVMELNGDKKLDVVIGVGRKHKIPFIQQEDGTYKRFDELQRSERERIESKLELERGGIESKLKDIKK